MAVRSTHMTVLVLFWRHSSTIRQKFGDVDEVEISSRLRTRMTEGQTFQEPNSFQRKLLDYHLIIFIDTLD